MAKPYSDDWNTTLYIECPVCKQSFSGEHDVVQCEMLKLLKSILEELEYISSSQ